jgi:hypothetical protein
MNDFCSILFHQRCRRSLRFVIYRKESSSVRIDEVECMWRADYTTASDGARKTRNDKYRQCMLFSSNAAPQFAPSRTGKGGGKRTEYAPVGPPSSFCVVGIPCRRFVWSSPVGLWWHRTVQRPHPNIPIKPSWTPLLASDCRVDLSIAEETDGPDRCRCWKKVATTLPKSRDDVFGECRRRRCEQHG